MNSTRQFDTAEVIRNYAKPVFGFALNRVKNRMEAEDLAQEILLQLLKSISSGADIQNLEALDNSQIYLGQLVEKACTRTQVD